ncbi:phosphate ABC transporter substrate-binding protein [Erysipelotrichaceae bacterium OttesenSCG-928-M19]|nr:phosphate ABC transporter substrate-binding protein [Erysipelotrichaceae bacterium OttesenSCG-928-M19]
MKKIKVLSFVMLFGLLILSGCSGKDDGGKIEISGSTSIAPLMTKLVEEYQNKGSIKININADGSSAGIKAASEGISDIGMVSREVEDDELALGLSCDVIAIDAIAVIVNKDSAITNLTKEQLHDIYAGKITNYSQIGGKDLPIELTTRETGSGTRDAFEETMSLLNEDKSSKVSSKAIVANSTGAVIENVKQKEGAIGYISLGSVDESIKVLSLNGIEPSEENVKANKYLLTRNFNLVTKEINEDTKAFLEFISSSEGQKVITDEGYIVVSK